MCGSTVWSALYIMSITIEMTKKMAMRRLATDPTLTAALILKAMDTALMLIRLSTK